MARSRWGVQQSARAHAVAHATTWWVAAYCVVRKQVQEVWAWIGLIGIGKYDYIIMIESADSTLMYVQGKTGQRCTAYAPLAMRGALSVSDEPGARGSLFGKETRSPGLRSPDISKSKLSLSLAS